MSIERPTPAGRAGLNLDGYGPGLSAPFGTSPTYKGVHHGQDYFWLGTASANKYGISTAQSKNVYPIQTGELHYIDSSGLGLGVWQQLDPTHRAYYWHLSVRAFNDGQTVDSAQRLGVMGCTGWAANGQVHLHFEVRKAPYGANDRIDPEPFFHIVELKPTERRVLSNAFANKRSAPTTFSDGKIIGKYLAGSVVNFTGYVHGESVKDNDVWFTDGTGFAWSGGFENTGVAGLKDLNPPPEPIPEPEPEPEPAPEPVDPPHSGDPPKSEDPPKQPLAWWQKVLGGGGLLAILAYVLGETLGWWR